MARKPFRAVPLRAVHSRPPRVRRRGRITPRLLGTTLAALTAVALVGVRWALPWPASETPRTEVDQLAGLSEEDIRRKVWPTTPEMLDSVQPRVASGPAGSRGAPFDGEAARFSRCSGPVRDNCVIDGDTFWYAGEKIRIADINTPEVSEPQCPREAALGARASERLLALLNQGAFTLESVDRDRDRYGRLLRTVTRDGTSLGAVLVREGLAEEWRGYRGGWC